MSNDVILVKLLNGPTTRAELGATFPRIENLVAAGFIQSRRVVVTGQRGRPAKLFALTSKGRGRAKRVADKVAA